MTHFKMVLSHKRLLFLTNTRRATIMKIAELTSLKASQLIGKIDTLIIPIGTIEAHGPHGSLMTDVLIPERLADEVDKVVGDRIFVGPPIPYGHTWELKDHPGSHMISRRALADYVFEVIKGFQPWKIRYVILLNGHGSVGTGSGGNIEPLHEAAERATGLGIKTVVLLWCFAPEVMKEIVEDIDGHAGEAETSVLWHIGDRYVDREVIPEHSRGFYSTSSSATLNDVFDPDLSKTAWPQAFWGKPIEASPEKGRLIIKKLVVALVELIEALRSGKLIVPDGYPKSSL